MNWFRNECERRRESLCLLASGALPEPEARELEAHLAECAQCRQYFTEVQSATAPLAGWEKRYARIEPTPAVKERWFQAVAAPATLAAREPRSSRRQEAYAIPPAGSQSLLTSAATDQRGKARSGSRADVSVPINVLSKLWLELIWPARRTWAGLAAVWLALAIFHFTQADHHEAAVAQSKVPAAEVRLAFREQQQLLAEILGPPPEAAPAEPPRRKCDQPRSERRSEFEMV